MEWSEGENSNRSSAVVDLDGAAVTEDKENQESSGNWTTVHAKGNKRQCISKGVEEKRIKTSNGLDTQ